MPHEDREVLTLDGLLMPGFLAWPDDEGPWPVALVLGALFGLTDVQRSAAERVAALGYVAIAPHLPHRRASVLPLPEDAVGRAQGLRLVEELTRLEVLSDVRDALDHARACPQADPGAVPVAVGMSFGGHVAVLAASRFRLRACVAMYAGWLAGTDIACSRPAPTGSLPLDGELLVLAGEGDPMIPLSDIEALRGWHPRAEIVTYPSVGHRFASEGRPGYDPRTAADAWSRVRKLLSTSDRASAERSSS